MKDLFLIVVAFLVLTLITNANAKAASGTSMKVEGTCSGTLDDGTAVSFVYYSDFDGCKNVNKGALTFTAGLEGLLTGSRTFKGDSDVYTFPENKLTFANSTGNTSGKLHYKDNKGVKRFIPVSCEVRDYEYPEC